MRAVIVFGIWNKPRLSTVAAQECSPGRKPWVKWATCKPRRGERDILTHTRKPGGKRQKGESSMDGIGLV